MADDAGRATLLRLQRLSSHLSPPPLAGLEATAYAGKKLDVSRQALAGYMRGKHRGMQERIFEFFQSRPELLTPIEISAAAHKELCFEQLRAMVKDAGFRPLGLVNGDPIKYFAIMEALGGIDVSLSVKFGVQYR